MISRAKRVLIIDADIQPRSALKLALERSGFRCDTAEDGASALRRATSHAYDVIITELMLPNTHGGELIVRLCGLKRSTLVIVYTHLIQQQVHRGLHEEGVDAIFYKPCELTTMVDTIQGMVNRRATLWAKGAASPFGQAMRRGDSWISHSRFRLESFRFTIIILAAVLFSLGWGHSLQPEFAGICRMYGLCGFAFYFCLEYVAYGRDRQRASLMQWTAEQRLAEHVEGTISPAPKHPLPQDDNDPLAGELYQTWEPQPAGVQ